MNEVLDKIGPVVNSLAHSLGVAAQQLFAVLVKQMVAEGVAEIVTIAIWVLILVGLLIFFVRPLIKTAVEHEELGDYLPPTSIRVIAVLVALGWLGISTACTSQSILKLMNPQYYAIERVLDKLRSEAR